MDPAPPGPIRPGRGPRRGRSRPAARRPGHDDQHPPRQPAIHPGAGTRSAPAAPPSWLLTRRAPRQTQLADYTIDAGSTVLVCPYTAHRDAREHPEPDRFRPERWLDDSGSSAKPGVFLGFGTGPHGCEGAALAMAMLTLMTAQTARRYHLSEPPGAEPGYRVTTFEGLATMRPAPACHLARLRAVLLSVAGRLRPRTTNVDPVRVPFHTRSDHRLMVRSSCVAGRTRRRACPS